MRMTLERRALFEEIYERHGHIDAESLYRGMKDKGLKISRATVYRNLDLLVECGLVYKQRLGGHRYLYEHTHPGQRHDHLVCQDCGRVVEFVSAGITALQAEICRAHGFEPGRPSLQITSLCTACSEKAGEKEPKGAQVPSPRRWLAALVLLALFGLDAPLSVNSTTHNPPAVSTLKELAP